MTLSCASSLRLLALRLFILLGFLLVSPSMRVCADDGILTPDQARLLERLSTAGPDVQLPAELCWTEGTDPRVVDMFQSILEGSVGKFETDQRWTQTATDGAISGLGMPTTLTWSIVPDGTIISDYASNLGTPSNLVAVLDANVPNWVALLEQALDRWGEVSGIRFVRELNDDGAPADTDVNPGILGVRGDVRIGGATLDGYGGILAFNYYPNRGDMVIDTADTYFLSMPDDNYRLFRNLMAHEAGHGIGLDHVLSNDVRFLMQPYIQTTEDGPQDDDIRGAQYFYGDTAEFPGRNETVATASELSSTGFVLTLSTANAGLNDSADVDLYRVYPTASYPQIRSISVSPVGSAYNVGPEYGGPQVPINSTVQQNLRVELLSPDGSSVLATAAATGSGQVEVLIPPQLPWSPTGYLVRVGSDGGSSVQRYQLDIDFDLATTDCNGNQVQDVDEIAGNAFLDCNANGFVDACEIAGIQAHGHVPGSNAHGISTNGNYAFVCNPASNLLQVVDVSDPRTPVMVGSRAVPGRPYDSVPVGNYLYVAAYDTGVYVLDISSLGPGINPPIVGNMMAMVHVLDFERSGDYLYLATGSNGLQFASIATRTNPFAFSSYSIANAKAVSVYGVFNYVAAGLEGLKIVNVQYGHQFPFLNGQVDTPGDATDIARLGTTHVVVADMSSVQIINVTNPLAPAIVSSIPGLTGASRVTVDGNLVYIGTADGILLYDLSDPLNPMLLSQAPTLVPANATVRIGDKLVNANGSDGVYVYNRLAFDADDDGWPDECGPAPTPAPVASLPYRLYPAIPNPFNPSTTIRFDLPRDEQVELTIYDLAGRRVRTLLSEWRLAGPNTVQWRGLDDGGTRVASGVYLYRLEAGEHVETRRMTLLK